MRFDFIIGNPPYQDETTGENKTFAPPVYHKFMDEAYKIADKVELVHPARFLFNTGSTPKEWNEKMLNDPHFKVLYYEPNSNKVFVNTSIKTGIAISFRDVDKQFGKVGIFCRYIELQEISKKVVVSDVSKSLTNIVFTQSKFNLDNLYRDYPDFINIIGSNGKDKRLRNNIFDKIPIFYEERNGKDEIAVIGVIKNKRCWRYIDSKYIDVQHDNLNKYKVIIPRANGTGAFGETLSTPIVIDPRCGYTQTFLGLGAFNKKEDADNLLKYVKTKFARALLGVLKVDQHNEKDTWAKIPLQDFTSNSDIDWSKSIHEIDLQLYKKYGLSDTEITFIESHVKEMI